MAYIQSFPCRAKKIPASFKTLVRHNFTEPCRFIREAKGKGQTLQHGNTHWSATLAPEYLLLAMVCAWQVFQNCNTTCNSWKKCLGHRKLLDLILHGVVFGKTLHLLCSKFAAGDKRCGISTNNFQHVTRAVWQWSLWLQCGLHRMCPGGLGQPKLSGMSVTAAL